MDNRVITFGLSILENETIEQAVATSRCEVLSAEVATDLIAIPAYMVIVNAEALTAKDKAMLFEYYSEVGSELWETVFWIASDELPQEFQKMLCHYRSFEEFALKLKYHILTAHGKMKKAKDFSDKISDCLIVLSEIRKKPGIKTKELARRLEKSERTVQRYITALQVAGEWIEYDYKLKGWRMGMEKSILFDL